MNSRERDSKAVKKTRAFEGSSLTVYLSAQHRPRGHCEKGP